MAETFLARKRESKIFKIRKSVIVRRKSVLISSNYGHVRERKIISRINPANLGMVRNQISGNKCSPSLDEGFTENCLQIRFLGFGHGRILKRLRGHLFPPRGAEGAGWREAAVGFRGRGNLKLTFPVRRIRKRINIFVYALWSFDAHFPSAEEK